MAGKKPKREKKPTIEEIYKNQNFVRPKEKNLETIFEEPRKAKDGAPVLTSVRKYKRSLHFDSTEGKIHKRKLKAKKCINKLKNNKLRTRSSPKPAQCEDISLYISEQMGESSDSEMGDCNSTNVLCSPDNSEITECNLSRNDIPGESSNVNNPQSKTLDQTNLNIAESSDSDVHKINPDLSNSFSGENEETSPSRSSCVIA